MKQDIEILERMLKIEKECLHYDVSQDEIRALEHLIKAYKELEYKYNKALSDLVQAEHKNKELEEENSLLIQQNITYKRNIHDLKNKTIPVSLVEKKRTKLKEQYNKVVNEINNQGMIDQLIDFKEVSAKLEMCEELLEKRK